jgi:nitrate reductase molybdenum cofactor assembly chaperone NarJ/NarW
MATLDAFTLARLADLVDYPGPTWPHVLEEARRYAGRLPDAARADLIAFLDWAGVRPAVEVEELYAATFDSSDDCALEVGWHLYGEAYQRGVFLVEMRGRLRQRGIEEGSELPDHLSHVLRWLAVADEKEGSRLERFALAPAVAAIVAGLERRANPYAPLLRAVLRAVDPTGAAVAARAPRAAQPQSFEGGCG